MIELIVMAGVVVVTLWSNRQLRRKMKLLDMRVTHHNKMMTQIADDMYDEGQHKGIE